MAETTLRPPRMRSARFNQDGRCLALATRTGFRIFATDPFRRIFNRELPTGCTIAEMLFTSNILAIVGDGSSPHYPPQKVVIWNDHAKARLEELAFASPVLDVRMREDIIVVVLTSRIYIYSFDDLRLTAQIETTARAAAVAPTGRAIICVRGAAAGSVDVHDMSTLPHTVRTIRAHDHPLATIAISADGRLVATASARGTLIRVFDTSTLARVAEFRRGNDPAVVSVLEFSRDGSRLAVCSDHGTVHVFDMEGANRSVIKYSLRSANDAIALCFGATSDTLFALTARAYEVVKMLPDGKTESTVHDIQLE